MYPCQLSQLCSDRPRRHFRGSLSPSFPYVASLDVSTTAVELRAQLIPGHEAIGSIVKMGKNVKGFSIGDRCVADVGITVSARHSHQLSS
jgi:threonine dehydrogenase-like Zn-dependent dehydrogenase